MEKRLMAILGTFLLLICSITLSAFAATGLTDSEIHIGQWGPQTGPAAPWGAVARGTDAYFKMINAEGGIHGRKIVYHYFDDAYNPAKTKAGVKQLQESDHGIFTWVGGTGSAPGMAVREYLMDRKVPWISPVAGSLAWTTPPTRYQFASYPLYIIEAKALVQYAVETMGKKRIAIVYQNDEYGKNGVTGAKMQLKEYGLELVAAIPKNLKEADVKPHVAALVKSKADAVLLWLDPASAIRTIGVSKAMRFSPQFMSTSTCADFPFMIKISRGLWKGVITSAFAATIDSGHPLVKKYKTEAFEKYASKGERWGTFYLAGFNFAEPLIEGLKRAGRNLTREKLVEAMERMNDFKGTLGAVSYKPLNKDDIYSRQGTSEIFLIQCGDKGKTEVLTDWLKPQFDPADVH